MDKGRPPSGDIFGHTSLFCHSSEKRTMSKPRICLLSAPKPPRLKEEKASFRFQYEFEKNWHWCWETVCGTPLAQTNGETHQANSGSPVRVSYLQNRKLSQAAVLFVFGYFLYIFGGGQTERLGAPYPRSVDVFLCVLRFVSVGMLKIDVTLHACVLAGIKNGEILSS